MKEQIFLGVIGFSGGLVIAGGVIALMVGLGVITRFIGISHTAKHVRIFEKVMLRRDLFHIIVVLLLFLFVFVHVKTSFLPSEVKIYQASAHFSQGDRDDHKA